MPRLLAFVERRPTTVLLAILLVGLALRAVMLPTAGFALDLGQHYEWATCGRADLLDIYTCEASMPVTHPPLNPTLLTLSTALAGVLGGDLSYFEDNPVVVVALKLPNLLFEIALILLFYRIAREKAGAGWALLATAALYLNPGVVVVTAWWGQNDVTYSFFMLIAAYLLTKDRPRWMWIAYGASWIAKFQSIIFFPVLFVLTVRRYGIRATLEGMTLGALLFAAVLLPFLLVSGEAALRPFVGTVNLFPYITNGAYNLWYWVSGSSQMVIVDSTPLIAGLSYQRAGLIALSIGTAILCLRAWLLPQRRDDYLLLALADFTFFMLATQVQARYLYPGLVFLALAMLRDWRLVALYVGFSLAFTYNVFDIVWLGIGLLYYPFQLMFWNETVTALAITLLYGVILALFVRPLVAMKDAAYART